MEKLYIVMVGLPARGKSTLALRLRDSLQSEGVRVEIFNNGELRRTRLHAESSQPEFYRPDNEEGRSKREDLARMNTELAIEFMNRGGQVAILDATNASTSRREFLAETLTGAEVLYLECINTDVELIAAGVHRKARLPEFSGLSHEEAVDSFMTRIRYYECIYSSPREERNYICVDTLHNRIVEERVQGKMPFHLHIRDVLVSGWVRELFLVRHGESAFNVENRIGGDAPLTGRGRMQAQALATEFEGKTIPYIFTSTRWRAIQTAEPLLADHPEAEVFRIPELDELDGGLCEGMRYEDIRRDMPEVEASRNKDKYNYVYPGGEGYASMRERVERGFLKALFLSGGLPGIVIVGHQAVNRLILSFFLYRRMEDVPYIFVPQDQYFRIVATYQRKLMERLRFSSGARDRADRETGRREIKYNG